VAGSEGYENVFALLLVERPGLRAWQHITHSARSRKNRHRWNKDRDSR